MIPKHIQWIQQIHLHKLSRLMKENARKEHQRHHLLNFPNRLSSLLLTDFNRKVMPPRRRSSKNTSHSPLQWLRTPRYEAGRIGSSGITRPMDATTCFLAMPRKEELHPVSRDLCVTFHTFHTFHFPVRHTCLSAKPIQARMVARPSVRPSTCTPVSMHAQGRRLCMIKVWDEWGRFEFKITSWAFEEHK